MNRQKVYKWDIAISLCKQDIDFARKLVKAINPSIKVFFYEDAQEQIITKSGPDEFAKTFKDESRVVIILSRNEWSESYYTEIERNAIIDRTSVKNEGYQFLMVIPMVRGEAPSWYPSTRIYVDPSQFTIEQIARFVEFKLSDEGGIVKQLTLEDRTYNLLNKIEAKKGTVELQEEKEGIQAAKKEVQLLKNHFNSKSDFLRDTFFKTANWQTFNEYGNKAHLILEEYSLVCQIILPDETCHPAITTQDFCLSFELFKVFRNMSPNHCIDKEERFFYYTQEIRGWSLKQVLENATEREKQVLFRNRSGLEFYDLVEILNTADIIDMWFQKLFSKSIERIEKHT